MESRKKKFGKRVLSLALAVCLLTTTVSTSIATVVFADNPTGVSVSAPADEQEPSDVANSIVTQDDSSASQPQTTENVGNTGSTPNDNSETTSTPNDDASRVPAETPAASATPDTETSSTPAPSPEASPAPSPEVTPSPSAEPSTEPSPEPEVSPEASPEPSPEVSPAPDEETEEENGEQEFVSLVVLDPEQGSTVTAEVGDTVTFTSGVNRDDVAVAYQWQKLQMSVPTESVTNTDTIYDYPEGAPTWYAFPLSDMAETQALEQNPDMMWSGIEMYYAAKDALDIAGLDNSNVSFAWQTPNYALDGYAISAADNEGVVEIYAEKDDNRYVARLNEEGKFQFADAAESLSAIAEAESAAQAWTDIEGATEPSYTFTVTEADHYAKYRLKVTILDENYLAQCVEILEGQGVELTDEQKAAEQILYSIVMSVESAIADEEAFIPDTPRIGMKLMANLLSESSAPYLSDDGQWICGLNGNYEYITEDTYNRANQWLNEGSIGQANFDAYWTKLGKNGWKSQNYANVLDENGFPTGAVRAYNGFDLTDGDKLEVASEWYGKTVYFRVTGTNSITKIEIPAYTELYGDGDKYSDAASGSKYKKAVVFLNPFPSDTPAMYENFLSYVSKGGWLAEMDSNGDFGQLTDIHIAVHSVNAEAFNADPQRYMVDAEGNYRVDSVGWGVCTVAEPDLSGKAYWVLKDYISQGYGFMTGHDTMYAYAGSYFDAKLGAQFDESSIDPNDGTTWYYDLNSWTPGTTAHDPSGNTSTTRGGHFYMNELMGSNSGNVLSGTTVPSDAPSLILSTGGSHGYYGKMEMYGSETLQVKQIGYSAALAASNPRYRTPTNYPYVFSQGQTFGVELTHTNSQAAFGTIWVDYYGPNLGASLWGAYEDPFYWTVDGQIGTNNFYLSGDGNYLMNQIGHLPTNSATSYESALFANSVMYISQRKQCEICAANQDGQQTSHFVRRISAANADAVLTALQNGGSYWYPIDGCYMLTEDITLPEDWTPIKGFKGHWNSDVYEVNLNSKGTPLLANDSADGESGWNLGTDQTKGVENVFNGNMERITGVARVVGDLNDLFETSTSYAGYTVKILGADNPKFMTADEEYSCEVNGDSKYVISNLPCLYTGADGILIARVYDPSGRQVTEYGTIIANIPTEFWNTDETVPLQLLDLSILPPADQTIWISQEANYEATILTNGYEYAESKITWEYKAPKGQWTPLNAELDSTGKYVHKTSPVEKDGHLTYDFLGTTTKLANQPFQYEIVHLGYVDTGDVTTSGTKTKLHIINAPAGLDGYEFRVVYQSNKGENLYSNVDRETGKESAGAKLTVRTPQMDSTMSGTQSLFMVYMDKNGNRVYNTYPADQWNELFNRTYDRIADENGVPYNNGNNEAVYTSEVLYLPHLSDSNVPTITWKYRNGTSTTEVPFYTLTYNPATKTWNAAGNDNYTAFTQQYPGLSISVTAGEPIAVDADGTPNPEGEWRKVVTTMTLTGARSEMDFDNTHYFFRTESTATFGAGDSAMTLTKTSPDADLYVLYDIDIYPNEGSVTYNKAQGNATWTFPELEVYAPNGLRTGIITFYEAGHSASNRIIVKAGNPYGIVIDTQMNDYVIFKSASGNLIPEKDWQDFFRNYVSFLTYDIKDDKTKDISWYIAEEDETKNFMYSLFDGTTNGWTGYGNTRYGPRGNWGNGGPSTWGGGENGYNNTVQYLGLSANSSGVSATITWNSDYKAPTWNGRSYYHSRGFDVSLSTTFDATTYSKLFINAAVNSPVSNGVTNSIALTGNNGTMYIFAPTGGRTTCTTGGLKVYDISALTGSATLTLRSYEAVHYCLNPGKDENLIGKQETSKPIVYEAYLLGSSFQRTDKSAIRYSEIWAVEVKDTITVVLTPDPEKVYDGTESRAYLTIHANGMEDFVRENATISYYKQNGSSWELVTYNPDVDGNSNCFHQGTYKAVVTFSSAVVNRYNINGLDAGSKDSVSVTFKITPRPVYLHSLYMDPGDVANNPRNVKTYDGTTSATIRDIIIDNVVTGDSISTALDSYPGTYATAQSGETLTADGRPQSDRLTKLTENAITRDPNTPINLIGNDYGDYYIASENYSGAICRELLEVRVKSFRFMYGSAAAPGTPTFDSEYRLNVTSDSWMNVSGLAQGDVLRLDSKFKLESLDKTGVPISFTNTTDVGTYVVEPKGLNESNYPVLSNYIVFIINGTVDIYPREIAITAEDINRYVLDTEVPEGHSTFEMLNDDEETYKTIGSDSNMEYGAMALIGDDTVANTILVGGTPLAKGTEATSNIVGEEGSQRTVFQNDSNIPYSTTWYQGAPVLYQNLEGGDLSTYPCEWCEEYHGFQLGTDHWRLDGYNLRVNQDAEQGPVLTIAKVENPLGEMVENYSIRYVDGLLYLHPELRFQLEATVPLEVCMYGYAGDGEVVEPENYGIINYSNGAIEITDIEVSADGWNIVDKAPAELLRGEMTMKMKDTQLVMGHNKPLNFERWVIAADKSEDDSGVEMLIPMTCYIAGGNVNERGEEYIAHVTYTIAEYGLTVPEVDGVELPDVIGGQPVTTVSANG